MEATYINHDTDLLDVTLRVSAPSATGATTATATTKQTSIATKSVASKTTHEETIHTTANHPWLTADHGWTLAGTLQVGEPVREADGTTAFVEAVRVVPGTASMWDLTVSNVHTFAVGLGAFVVHNCGSVQPGDVGAYKDLKGTTGDGLTPHHMPQGSLAKHFGFDYDRGGTIVMDAATHSNTFSYGGRAIGVMNRTIRDGLTFRQALAESIWDYRSLVPDSNGSVRQLIQYWRDYRPDLMAK